MPFPERTYALYETDAILAAIDLDGFALLPGLLSEAQCAETRRRIDALRPLGWDETHTQVGNHLDRYLCIFNRDPYWLPFLDRPGIIDVAEAALGADCHIIGQTAWRSHPGFRGEPLHTDYVPFTWPQDALPERVCVPPFVLSVHFYLSAVTAELAPTRIVPGSHRAGREPRAGETRWRDIEPQPVLTQAGDCFIFRSDIWHAGSDNRTARDVRYLLQVHYGRREMAQHFSPFMEWRFDPQVLAAASPRQRRLLGDHGPGGYD